MKTSPTSSNHLIKKPIAHILAVDDDFQALISIAQVLENAGRMVNKASSGQQALDLVLRHPPDLVVLDIIMPEMDGVEVCRQIRADPFLFKLPIIFLTAKGRPEDIARGLDAGGDDYLTKPFEVLELPARVRALLRRAPGGPLDLESEHLVAGDLQLHGTRSEVQVKEQLIQLSTAETRLLNYLMLHAGQPVSDERLLEDIWGYPLGTGDPKLVSVHIANLRAKIDRGPPLHNIF